MNAKQIEIMNANKNNYFVVEIMQDGSWILRAAGKTITGAMNYSGENRVILHKSAYYQFYVFAK